MAKLKVPSLQHLARIWQPDPRAICKTLVNLAKNGPIFSYEPLHQLVRDMLLLRVPYWQIVEGIERAVKQESVKENFLSLLPLIDSHFSATEPTFVHAVAPRYYPVGRELLIPFRPPLIYGSRGLIHFPWLSFWRVNPLSAERLSLFVSIVDDVLLQDSDLEEASFEILDFSAPAPKRPRELSVIQARDIPRLSASNKAEMLSVFADGFLMAQEELRLNPVARKVPVDEKQDKGIADDQMPLFEI